jgi:hypothetical protein
MCMPKRLSLCESGVQSKGAPSMTYSSARDKVPQHTLGALDRYVEHHLQPGGFLLAVLENNLREAFIRADNDNLDAMRHIVTYCYNHIPFICWGSPKVVEAWLAARHEGEEK